MVAGAAQVRTTIVVKGNDQASKVINKANGAVGKLSGKLKAAQGRASALGGAMRSAMSGDVSGAVSGLSTAVAGLGSSAAVAAVGVGALGVAAGVAAVKFTAWSVEINRLKAGLDAALGENGVEKAIALSNALGGVSAEAVGKVATRLKLAGVNAEFTSEQLTELTQRATIAGKTGDEAMQALASAIEKGNTRALKMVGTFVNSSKVLDDYARSIGKTTTQLTSQEQQIAVVAALQKNLNKDIAQGNAEHDRQDKVLSRLDNTWLRFKVTLSDALGGPMAGISETVVIIADGMVRLTNVVINLVKVGFRPLVTWIEAVTTAALGAGEVAIKLFEKDWAGAVSAATRASKLLGKTVIDDNVNAFLDLGEAVENVVNPALKETAATSLKIGGGLLPQLEQFLGAVDRVAGTKVAKRKTRTGKSPAALAREAEATALVESVNKEIAAEEAAKQAKIANLLEVADIQSQVSKQIHDDRMKEKVVAQQVADADKAASAARAQSAFTTAAAIGKSAASQIESEQARAGVMALIAAAEAAWMFSHGDFAGGAFATWAALNYARAAFTTAPSVSGSGGAASGSTGTNDTGSPATAGAVGGGGGPTNININFQSGLVVGTAQKIGREAAMLINSINGTGLETAGSV